MLLAYPSSSDFKRPTVAIGNFDGVHAGHRALLAQARGLGKPVVVLTFEPHPRAVLQPQIPFKRLTLAEQKMALLLEQADAVAVLPFTLEVAGWTPEEFIQRVLVGWLDAGAVVVGENFRFGHRAAGTVETLAANSFFETLVVPLVKDGGGVISSSRLRENS